MEQSEQINELAAALSIAQGGGDRHSESALLRQIAKSNQPTTLQKFMSRLVFGMSDCWYWNGSVDDLGYGRFVSARKDTGEIKAHRIAWVLFNERPIPDGMMILHSCDVRNCVNPDHLSLGTQLENMTDMVRRGRHRVVPMPGESNPQAKLTKDAVLAMRKDASNGMNSHQAAKKYGVAVMTANRAIRGETWKQI